MSLSWAADADPGIHQAPSRYLAGILPRNRKATQFLVVPELVSTAPAMANSCAGAAVSFFVGRNPRRNQMHNSALLVDLSTLL
eukprot:2664544-Rhodomonas_salina.1